MQNVPDQVTIETADATTTYTRAVGHYLVRLAPGSDRESLTTEFASAGLAAESPPSYVEASRATLDPGGFVWVEATEQFSADDADAQFEANDNIDQILPVYFESGEGPESAVSPMIDSITILVDGDASELIDSLTELGLRYNEAGSSLLRPFRLFNLPDATTVEEAFALLDAVRSTAGVVEADLDWLRLQTYLAAPNDPLYAHQWNMDVVELPAGRGIETGSEDVWIAVVDSGFDLTHPDLNFTTNHGPSPTHFNADQALAGNPPPYDASSAGVFHGTCVAGIAGAATDNGIGVSSVGGSCLVMPLRLGSAPSANRVTAALNWAVDNGALVVNMSLYCVATPALTTALNNAWGAGLVMCAASGNYAGNTASPPVRFPARHPLVIAVGASDQDDERKRPASSDGETWWGSHFDATLDVVAPGVLIWTTDEQGFGGYEPGDYRPHFRGTSAATPHVSGLAGLMLSADPSLSNQQVRDIIESTCDKISPFLYDYAVTPGRPAGTWHEEVGYGRINVRSALTAIASVAAMGVDCRDDPRVHYLTHRGRAVELGWWNERWNQRPVADEIGAPDAFPGSGLATIGADCRKDPRLYYVTTDSRVVELGWWNGRWNQRPVADQAGAPDALAGGPLVAMGVGCGNDPRVYYLSAQDGSVIELGWWNEQWNQWSVSEAAGAAPAASGGPLATMGVGCANDPRIYYVVNRRVVELGWWNGQWNERRIAGEVGAPNVMPDGPLVALGVGCGSDPRVYYLNAGDGSVTELGWWNGRWNLRPIGDEAGAPKAVPGTSLAATGVGCRKDPRVYYVADGGRIVELGWWNGRWNQRPIADEVGAVDALSKGPMAAMGVDCVNDPRTYYLSAAESKVIELGWWNERWNQRQISDEAAVP